MDSKAVRFYGRGDDITNILIPAINELPSDCLDCGIGGYISPEHIIATLQGDYVLNDCFIIISPDRHCEAREIMIPEGSIDIRDLSKHSKEFTYHGYKYRLFKYYQPISYH
jgi:hypothetical protein